MGDDEDGIVFEGLGASEAAITLTASVGGLLPVVFSGVDVIVPASTANDSLGAVLDISEKVSILLGTTSGSLKFGKAVASGDVGSGSLVAATNAKITATDSGSYTKLPASAGFNLGSDSDSGALAEIASGNASGVWTLADLSGGLFAEEGTGYAVIDYATVLVDE
jgi:hypothetical protein